MNVFQTIFQNLFISFLSLYLTQKFWHNPKTHCIGVVALIFLICHFLYLVAGIGYYIGHIDGMLER